MSRQEIALEFAKIMLSKALDNAALNSRLGGDGQAYLANEVAQLSLTAFGLADSFIAFGRKSESSIESKV